MATMKRKGYGQVEPNHLSAQRTGQIYAQGYTEAAQIENGQFVKYNGAGKAVDLNGAGEWMLVYNEEKLREWDETRKDFVMKKTDAIGEKTYVRLFKTNVGDIYTTNCLKTAGNGGEVTMEEYAVDDKLIIDTTTGFLKDAGETSLTGLMVWQVVNLTTMPDGQDGVKIMRIQ